MQNNSTVVLGEASEESDVEDTITTDEENVVNNSDDYSPHDNSRTTKTTKRTAATTSSNNSQSVRRNDKPEHGSGYSSRVSSKLFGSSSSGPSLISKLASYAPQSIIAAASSAAGFETSIPINTRTQYSDLVTSNKVSLLQRNLQAKDEQLKLCLQHMFKQPFDKSSKDLHNVSQRLVRVQRILQEVSVSVDKLQREEKNISMMSPVMDF